MTLGNDAEITHTADHGLHFPTLRTFSSEPLSMSTPSSSRPSHTAQAGFPEIVNRHAPTPLELQRIQLAKLLKDPTKEVVLPKGPKEKTLRPPREVRCGGIPHSVRPSG